MAGHSLIVSLDRRSLETRVRSDHVPPQACHLGGAGGGPGAQWVRRNPPNAPPSFWRIEVFFGFFFVTEKDRFKRGNGQRGWGGPRGVCKERCTASQPSYTHVSSTATIDAIPWPRARSIIPLSLCLSLYSHSSPPPSSFLSARAAGWRQAPPAVWAATRSATYDINARTKEHLNIGTIGHVDHGGALQVLNPAETHSLEPPGDHNH